MLKQVIIVRTDLKMGKGKIATQCAHASIASFLKSDSNDKEKWLNEGMKKVVLKVSSEKEIKEIFRQVKKEKLACEIIVDAGLTQLEPGTITALGIGPIEDKKIDKITGKLKLL
jgi:PTH2 family peptidyl-tRNA hydrolase